MVSGQDNLRVAAENRAVFAQLADGEGVIVDTETAFYFGLNRTAAFLWERLQAPGGAAREDLVLALCARFAVERPEAERDVSDFLEQLVKQGLASRLNEPGAGSD